MKFKFVPPVGCENPIRDILFTLEVTGDGLFMDSADKTFPVEKVVGTLYSAMNVNGFFVRYVGPDIDSYKSINIHEGTL